MRWMELSVTVDDAGVNEAAAVLGEYGHGGAIVEEGQENDHGVKVFCVKAYLPYNRSYKGQRQQIEERLRQTGGPVSNIRECLLKPDDWLDSLRQHFTVLEIGSRFVVKPSWADTTSHAAGRTVLELDPGAAFGTGLHATTRLCLIHLEKNLQPGMTVFDLGTGSGILAIAAVKLGASAVLAVDIDPVAVRAAGNNARTNGVSDQIRFRRGTLSLRAQRVHRNAFDLALANITSRAIADFSGGLFKVLKPGGRLIASGIHPQGLDEVLISLALCGFNLETVDCEGEWYAVVARKPENEDNFVFGGGVE